MFMSLSTHPRDVFMDPVHTNTQKKTTKRDPETLITRLVSDPYLTCTNAIIHVVQGLSRFR